MQMQQMLASYLMRILFTNDDAAPITNPYVGEVGSVVPVEVDGTLAAASGVLTNTAQATPAEGDLGFYSSVRFARVNGRGLYCKLVMNTLNTYPIIHWNPTQQVSSVGSEVTVRVENPLAVNDGGYFSLGRTLTATTYEFWLILHATGAELLVKGGVFADWSRRWVFNSGSSAQLAAAIGYYNGLASVDEFTVKDLGSPFNSSAPATSALVTSFPSSLQTVSNHSMVELTFALPGSPSAGQKIHIYYRVPNPGDQGVNCWDAYLERNAGNTAWDFKLDSLASSVATNRVSATGVGNVTTIRVMFDGNNHDCWTLVGTAWTKRGTTISNATYNTGTGVISSADVGFTESSLKVWTNDQSAYATQLTP